MNGTIGRVIVLFSALSILSSFTCKNSALGLIEEIGICKRFYPKYYIIPARWMRKVFKVRQTRIPIFLYVELFLSIAFFVLGPINIAVSLFSLMISRGKGIIGVLVLFQASLSILNALYLAIMVRYYKNQRSETGDG